MRLLTIFLSICLSSFVLSQSTVGVKRDNLLLNDNSIVDIGQLTPTTKTRVPKAFLPYEATLVNAPLGVKYGNREISPPEFCDADGLASRYTDKIVETCPIDRQLCATGFQTKDGESLEEKGEIEYPYQGSITLGKDAYRYLKTRGGCESCKQRGTFVISNQSQIKDFKLTRVSFDDWIKVTINSFVVYVGPYGGDILDILDPSNRYSTIKYQLSPPLTNVCELSTPWDTNGPKFPIFNPMPIDMTPFVVSGTNNFEVEVITADVGQAFAKFTFKAKEDINIKCGTSLPPIGSAADGKCNINTNEGYPLDFLDDACTVEINKILPNGYKYYNYNCPVEDAGTKWFVDKDYGGDCNPTSISSLTAIPPNNTYTCQGIDENCTYTCNSSIPPTDNCRRLNATCPVDTNQRCARLYGGNANAVFTSGTSQTFTQAKRPYFKICKKNEIIDDGKCFIDSDNNKIKDDFIGSVPRWQGTITLGNRTLSRFSNGSSCTTYTDEITFDSNDMSRLVLKETLSDDWIKVTLNGQIAHVGPNKVSPTILNVFDPNVEYRPGVFHHCGSGLGSENDFLNKDISAFIIPGTNTLKIESIVWGTGEGYAEFEFGANSEITTWACTNGPCSLTQAEFMTDSCPAPYKEIILSDRTQNEFGNRRCARPADCPVGHPALASDTSICAQDTYTYQRCFCPDGTEPIELGGDLTDNILLNQCPPTNCFSGNLPGIKASFRQLIKPSLKGGFKTGEYGSFFDTLCTDPRNLGVEGCQFRLTRIYADNNGSSLCFEDGFSKTGCIDMIEKCTIDGNCSLDAGCEFNGDVKESTRGFGKYGIQQLVVKNDKKTIEIFDTASVKLGEITSTCDIEGKVGHSQKPFSTVGQITSIRANGSRIEFWDSFRRGFIGAIEFIPVIPQQDINDGYTHLDTHISKLHDEGFILFTKIDDTVYAVHKDSITQSECNSKLTDTGFYIPQARGAKEYITLAGLSFEGGFTHNYNNPSDLDFSFLNPIFNRPNGSCIIKKHELNQRPFYLTDISVKKETLPLSQSGAIYQCSPFRCDSAHTCQKAQCTTGYSGNILKPDDATLANNLNLCIDDICDYNQPFFGSCGTLSGCDETKDDIIGIKTDLGIKGTGVLAQSTCKKITCPGGELIVDENGAYCKKFTCPKDAVENASGECIKTLYGP